MRLWLHSMKNLGIHEWKIKAKNKRETMLSACINYVIHKLHETWYVKFITKRGKTQNKKHVWISCYVIHETSFKNFFIELCTRNIKQDVYNVNAVSKKTCMI